MTPMLCATRSCSSRAIGAFLGDRDARALRGPVQLGLFGASRDPPASRRRSGSAAEAPDAAQEQPSGDDVLHQVAGEVRDGRRRARSRPSGGADDRAAPLSVRSDAVEPRGRREAGLERLAELELRCAEHQEQDQQRPRPADEQRHRGGGRGKACTGRSSAGAPVSAVQTTT